MNLVPSTANTLKLKEMLRSSDVSDRRGICNWGVLVEGGRSLEVPNRAMPNREQPLPNLSIPTSFSN